MKLFVLIFNPSLSQHQGGESQM